MSKIKKNRFLIDPKFIGDVCRRCDEWLAKIKSHHGEIVSDVIYKCTSDWKDYAAQHFYAGYMGVIPQVSMASGATARDELICNNYFFMLLGASDVLREFGLTLHFGEDGKHAARYHVSEVLVDEDDI